MKAIIIKLFRNNGHLRGLIYTVLGLLTPASAVLAQWGDSPPKNRYVMASAAIAVLLGGVTSLRAYLDQHISRNPNAENPTK